MQPFTGTAIGTVRIDSHFVLRTQIVQHHAESVERLPHLHRHPVQHHRTNIRRNHIQKRRRPRLGTSKSHRTHRPERRPVPRQVQPNPIAVHLDQLRALRRLHPREIPAAHTPTIRPGQQPQPSDNTSKDDTIKSGCIIFGGITVDGFIGRQRELGLLERSIQRVVAGGRAGRPGRAILIRGRRRVGKSRLAEEFVERSGLPFLFFTASAQRSPELDLRQFVEAGAASTLPDSGKFLGQQPKDWSAALALLASALPTISQVSSSLTRCPISSTTIQVSRAACRKPSIGNCRESRRCCSASDLIWR